MRIAVAIWFALAVSLAAPAGAFFTVHPVKVSTKATTEPPTPGDKIGKGKINNKVLINLLNYRPIDTPVPKNHILVLLIECPWDEEDVQVALWDTDTDDLVPNGVAGNDRLPLFAAAPQEQLKGGVLDRINMVLQLYTGDDLLAAPGTMRFRELGKKFGNDAGELCASEFKSQSTAGYVEWNAVLILKGKLKAAKPIRTWEP